MSVMINFFSEDFFFLYNIFEKRSAGVRIVAWQVKPWSVTHAPHMGADSRPGHSTLDLASC